MSVTSSVLPTPSDYPQEASVQINLKNEVIQNVTTNSWRRLDDVHREAIESVFQGQNEQARRIASIEREGQTREVDISAELARASAQHVSDLEWTSQRLNAAENAVTQANMDQNCLRDRVQDIEASIIENRLTMERRMARLTISDLDEDEVMQTMRDGIQSLEDWQKQSTERVEELERGRDRIMGSFQDLREDLEQTNERVENGLESLDGRQTQSMMRVAELELGQEETSGSLSSLQDDFRQAQTQSSTRFAELERGRDKTSGSLNTLQANLSQAQTQIGRHRHEINDTQIVLSDLNHNHQRLDGEQARLTERVGNLESREIPTGDIAISVESQIPGLLQRLDALDALIEEQRDSSRRERSQIQQEGLYQIAECLRRLDSHDASLSDIGSRQETQRGNFDEINNTVAVVQGQSNTLHTIQRDTNNQLDQCRMQVQENSNALTGIGATQMIHNSRLEEIDKAMTTALRRENPEAWKFMAERIEGALEGRVDTEMSRALRRLQSQMQQITTSAPQPNSSNHRAPPGEIAFPPHSPPDQQTHRPIPQDRPLRLPSLLPLPTPSPSPTPPTPSLSSSPTSSQPQPQPQQPTHSRHDSLPPTTHQEQAPAPSPSPPYLNLIISGHGDNVFTIGNGSGTYTNTLPPTKRSRSRSRSPPPLPPFPPLPSDDGVTTTDGATKKKRRVKYTASSSSASGGQGWMPRGLKRCGAFVREGHRCSELGMREGGEDGRWFCAAHW